MRRVGTEAWSGIAMLVVSVAVAAPVLLGSARSAIPRGWWTLLFVLFLAALLGSVATSTSRRVRYAGFAVAVLCSWVVVLTATGLGLLLILLVVTAAVGVHVVPLGADAAVVALNTGVVAAATVSVAGATTEAAVVTVFYLLIQVATVLSTLTLLKEQRTRRELAEAHVDLRAASVLLSESARTAERLRISRELHDLIGHQLTVLTLELETARHLDAPAGRDHLDRADRVARDLLRDVRAVVGRLRTTAPDLERALRDMTRDLPGLAVSVAVARDLRLADEQTAALVRAAQEIVTNTIRHAEASVLRLQVTTDEQGTVLVGRDDGHGAAEPVLGNGLLGLRERLAELGGEVTVDGRHGFRVTARLPPVVGAA